MASLAQTAALWLSLCAAILGQFVTAPADLTTTKGYYDQTVRYKEVPNGTCELTPGVKSYSGYVDVAENEHIFWWFFEARNEDPQTAPLTVWINGGPGSSSMIGVFQETGPCGVDSNYELYYNPYAWNNVSNMLFVDQPAQTGFSYSIPIPAYYDATNDEIIQLPNASCPEYAQEYGTCGTYSDPIFTDTANTTANAAPSMWKTLQGFMGAFPQYSRNEFNFATESYGGHFGPIFNEYFEEQNAQIATGGLPGAHSINLRTLTIGNGWFDPLIQYAAYYNFTVSPGNTYDFSPFNTSIAQQMYNAMYGPGNCQDRILQCASTGIDDVCSSADDFCYSEVEIVLDDYAGRDEYDVRELLSDPFPYSFYTDYLNQPSVLEALGAFVNFSEAGGDTVYTAYTATGDDNREDGTVQAVQKLIQKGIYVVLYAGDADYICNWLGVQAVAAEIGAPGWASAGFENISTSDGVVHGQVKQSSNFAFARIYESGHEVPFYQPVVALELFARAIRGQDVATGHRPWAWTRTAGPAESTYREGNATVVDVDLPDTATYNTTTNEPNPVTNGTTSAARLMARRGVEGVGTRPMYRPSRRGSGRRLNARKP